ncbi:YcxB family protein [Sporolactobacillus nakayamae]|uniref:YcxB family protein n=1 Tax=Sporolactobacillus nakayamae TaxID=269670 RepID=UPI000B8661A9|nr:YcxB family protein [Sporolactobacillus nakayamae]
MDFHYQLTKEDYIAFNLNAYEHSLVMKRSLITTRLLALIFIIFPLIISQITGVFIASLFYFFCILAILWFFIIPKIFFRSVRRNLSKMIDEKMGDQLPMDERLEITEEGLIEGAGSNREYRSAWSGIVKISETDDYLYFYINPMAAIILPKSEIEAHDLGEQLKKIIPESVVKE